MTAGKEKIEMVLTYLGLKAPTFAKRIGVNYQRINDIQNEKTKRISYELAAKICAAFPEFNIDWLVGEREESPLGGLDVSDMLREESNDVGDVKQNPYFENFALQGGYGHGDGEEQALTPDGYMSVPGINPTNDIPFLKVRGKSMLNTRDPEHSIAPGSWVAVKRVVGDAIRWGEVYAVMTVDGPIVKRLMPSDRADCVKCVSFNEDYPPFDLPTIDILKGEIYIVKGVVNVQIWN